MKSIVCIGAELGKSDIMLGDRESLGLSVGKESLGFIVGEVEESALGGTVGNWLGLFVGDSDRLGDTVGIWLGFCVGDSDRLGDELIEGENV